MVKQRHLIIFPGNFLPHIGGLETHVDEFAKHLSKHPRYSVTIFSPDVIGATRREVLHKRVRVLRYPAFELIPNFPVPQFWNPVFYKMFFGLYQKKYDIVMSRTRFFTNSLLALIFSKWRFKRIPFVHVEHGSSYVLLGSKLKSKLAWLYDKTLGALVISSADSVISISSAVDRFVRREFKSRKKPVLIRRGIDFELMDKAKPHLELKRLFKGKIIFTTICRMYHWKGIDRAIDAYKQLPVSIRKQCVYVLGGDGEDFGKLQKRAGKYLQKEIYFLGKTEFEETFSIMKTANIFIHASYPGGGLSSSLLQAMYCSCVPLSSPHEGAKDVVNATNGILLKSNSTQEIKKGMQQLIKDVKLRSQLSKKAKATIKQDFDWEHVIDQYDNVFSKLLDS